MWFGLLSQTAPRAHNAGPNAGQRNAVVTAEGHLKYNPRDAERKAGVAVVSRHELRACPYWQYAFASQHKDHRYYDLVDETIHPEFQYLYFVMRDSRGRITAIQPFFIVEQDILTGVRPYAGRAVDIIHQLFRGGTAALMCKLSN